MPDPTPPFPSSTAHLLAELERIDLLTRIAVTRARAVLGQADPLHGLYITEADVDRMLARPLGAPLWMLAPPPASPAKIAATLHLLEQRIAARLAATPAPTRLTSLSDRLGLSPFERDALLIALAPELDLRFERLYAWMQDDVSRRRPSVDLMLALLQPRLELRLPLRAAFAPESPLIRHELLVPVDEPSRPATGLLATALRVDNRLVDHLLERDVLEPRLEGMVRIDPHPAGFDSLIASDALKDALARLADGALSRPTFVALQSPAGTGRRTAAGAMAARLGRPLLRVDVAELGEGQDLARRLRWACREALLLGAILCYVGLERLPDRGRESRSAALIADSLSVCPLVLGTHDGAWEPPLASSVITVRLPRLDFAGRRALWSAALGEGSAPLLLDELAMGTRLDGHRIRAAVAAAGAAARLRGDPIATPADLAEGARRVAEPARSGLVERLKPVHAWTDLVLPPRETAQLRELEARVRHRVTVLERWGLGQRFDRGTGLYALFYGPPGTGKTMAAGVVARALGVDLFRVDLSQVVDKYIGETEKQLARVFDAAQAGGAVLLFDEADALFGKRTAVRDAHDRYANIQVSYLLQRMEEYDGLSVLATNQRTSMDEAFLRRIGLAVEFPFPEPEQRRAIWAGMLHDGGVPLGEDVDLAFLGRFALAGGNIRNVVLAAAYQAADAGGAVDMRHLVRATAEELRKLGRACLRTDFEHYLDLLDTVPARVLA